MNAVLKIFLSMSFSGSLLILALLFGKQFLKNKISRQWQYYIWLVVVLRLLLPFGTEVSLMGKAYQTVDQAISQAAPLSPQQQSPRNAPGGNLAPAVGAEHHNETVSSPADDVATAHPLQDIGSLLINHIWLVWLVAALGLLIRKITIYQGFVRYIKAGLTPVSDIERLDELSIVAEQSGIKKPIELCANPLVFSPLLIGFFHSCIVLPSVDIPEKDFRYIILHELMHYKRRDMFYKWLVQITVCLHWFNPLVHLMSREITKACEFSCDEAVLVKMGSGNAQDYGKTLLDAMAAVGRYKENLGAVTLSENKQLLKERINAIMDFKKKSTVIRLLTGALTLCVIFGAAFVGVYPAAAAADTTIKTPSQTEVPTPFVTTPSDTSKTSPEYVEVDFSGISITGKGPVGVDLVRTSEADVTFEYLNMEHPKNCTTSANVVNGIMQITITHSAPDGINVDFGSKPQNIVRIHIPDAVYSQFDITSEQMVLHMQDFNAPVHVTSKQAGFSLIDANVSRGTYDIEVNSGPLYIEADTILKDITANVNNGPIKVCFNGEPANLYLDTTGCGPGWVTRPADWPAIYQIGDGTPKMILSNYGPATIEVVDK